MAGEASIIESSVATVLAALSTNSVQTTITSPPYFRQKDYRHKQQIGWERSVGEYVQTMRDIFSQLWRLTAPSGCCFMVVGDTYINKSLQLVPQRLAIAACECGWTLRNDLIWAKTDAAPDGAAQSPGLYHVGAVIGVIRSRVAVPAFARAAGRSTA